MGEVAAAAFCNSLIFLRSYTYSLNIYIHTYTCTCIFTLSYRKITNLDYHQLCLNIYTNRWMDEYVSTDRQIFWEYFRIKRKEKHTLCRELTKLELSKVIASIPDTVH